VPGFLGFQRLHTLSYFADVQALLEQPFVEAGREVVVKAIRTLPTSSLGARAARLAEVVHGLPAGAEIHLVGHSTGGLDCRLFLAPGAALPTEVDVGAAAARVRSVVTVATPHHGAPLASLFTGVHGHRLMSLASTAITRVMQRSRQSMTAVVELGKVIWLLDRLAGVEPTVREPLREELRAELERLGDESIEHLLDDIGDDTSLLEHLTPTSLALLNTTMQNRPGVRYGSVVAMAPRPRLLRLAKLRLDPLARLTYAIYIASHRLAGLAESQRLPPLRPDQERSTSFLRVFRQPGLTGVGLTTSGLTGVGVGLAASGLAGVGFAASGLAGSVFLASPVLPSSAFLASAFLASPFLPLPLPPSLPASGSASSTTSSPSPAAFLPGSST
jgi:hypothetical protein